MGHQSGTGRRRATFACASVAALALAGLADTTSYAAGGEQPADPSPRASTPHLTSGFYDVRDSAGQTQRGLLRTAEHPSAARSARAVPSARAFSLAAPADETVTDLDANTGTVRMRVNLDGFLTPASGRSPRAITLSYVRANHQALGLTLADVNTFHVARDYRDIDGQHHLFFTQKIKQRHVLGNGLTATVNKAGHLVTLGGSPTSRSRLDKVASVTASAALPTASDALDEAQAQTPTDPSSTATAAQDSVTRGLFVVGGTAHAAYQATITSSADPAVVILDANTGKVLERHPLTDDESASTGRAYRFFPGARKGGKQVYVNFTKRHWLSGSATILSGNNSHTYSDVDDNDRASKNEEVHPLHGHSWGYRLKPFHLSFAKSFCGKPWPCSWNPNQPNSWKVNRAQNATQVFYFVNNWHDHLRKAPIGFTEAAGNFQKVNHTKYGKGGDPVITQTDDGADTRNGLPNSDHVDNANMTTYPDGRSPVMQMYLQHAPHTSYPNGDPFSPTNVGDEADTVYHEYTHGLSNRLNVDVQDHSTLGGVQAGAMGEAWSDWYAMDYLVDRGLERDRAGRADVRPFVYDGAGVAYDRTEPIDCRVGQHVAACPGGDTGQTGGYTYADYGKVVGFPEVHGDGEIWAQTLWSLRAALGSKRTESLVTRAMEMAPYNPSFLDMRNAIIAADNSIRAGHGLATIWNVFTSRGMGYFAGSFGGNDRRPAASTANRPTSPDLETLQGTVADASTGKALVGATVRLAFQGSGTANPTAVTGSGGHFTLTNVPAGHYVKLQTSKHGYLTKRQQVTVGASGTTVALTLQR